MCSQTCRKITGFGLLVLTFLLFVGAVVLTGFTADITSYHVTDSNWNSITGFIIFMAIYLSLCLVLGGLAFWKQSKIIILVFIVFYTICAVFVLLVGALVLAFGTIKYDSTQQGCTDNNHGLAEIFSDVDKIFQASNDLLCSADCPCKFAKKATYAAYPNTSEEQSFWTNTSGTAGNVEECAEDKRTAMWAALTAADSTMSRFNQGVVYDFFRKLEEKFNCTGWCSRSYLVQSPSGSLSLTTRTRRYVRYLFVSLDTEPVATPGGSGCMKETYDYIGPILVAYGSIMIFVFLTLVVTLVLAFTMCYKDTDK